MGRPGQRTTDFMPPEMIEVLELFTTRRTSVFQRCRNLRIMVFHPYDRSAVSVVWALPESGISPNFNDALSTE
jgi:hypothetical protein